MAMIISRDGDTVPLLIWQHWQRSDDDAEEAFYDANPGLEQHGPVLPMGLKLTLPEPPQKAPQKANNIWD